MGLDLPALDALSDRHLTLTSEQWYYAHFTKIKPDWVVGFIQRAGREIEVKVVFLGLLFVIQSKARRPLQHLGIGLGDRNVCALKAVENVFDVVRGHHVLRYLTMQLVET